MNYDKNKYIGKRVQLFPHDTFKKQAIILDVDDLGWTFKIIQANNDWNGNPCEKVGSIKFYNHTSKVQFEFI